MKIEYEPKHDIMNIEFLKGTKIKESIETDGVIFDYSNNGKIVSIEILEVSKRISKSPLDTIDFSIVREKVEA